MIRLIGSVVLLLVVAVLVVLNAEHTTPFNLFGYNIESVSVIGVALISFAIGVLYSFILYAMHYVQRARKRKLATRESEVKRYKQEQKKSGGRHSSAALNSPQGSGSGSAASGGGKAGSGTVGTGGGTESGKSASGAGNATTGAAAGTGSSGEEAASPRRGKKKGGVLSRLGGKA